MSEKAYFERRRPLHKQEKADTVLEDVDDEKRESHIFDGVKNLKDMDFDDIDSWRLSDLIATEVRARALSLLRAHDFEGVIAFSLRLLTAFEVTDTTQVSTQTPAAAIAVAETCNLAAKMYHPGVFYAIKPAAIVAAWKLGADFGLGEDEAYFLADPIVGTASFHDPEDEVRYIITNILHEEVPIWPHPWSGVERQGDAMEILGGLQNDGEIVGTYADTTLPEEMKRNRDKWIRAGSEPYRAQIADILSKGTMKKN